MKLKHLITLTLTALTMLTSCAHKTTESSNQTSDFVTVRDGKFFIGDKEYRYVGTNFWYGAILASEGRGGNRERLHKELDEMQRIGIDNLRILVGGDGDEGIASHIAPTLQTAPGVYNDTILEGLDYLLIELEKRNMRAVLYLNNAWEWSGGYGSYLEWAGEGKAPVPSIDSWPTFMKYVSKFATNERAHELFFNHIRNIVSRTNSINGKPYTESPAIMSWQIANEPRAFGNKNKEPFAEWILKAAKLIKSLDSNHLVSTGSEGSWGCENDLELWNRIHCYKEIDYANIHIWPYNWSWVTKETISSGVENACKNTKEYITQHYELMKKAGKPVVLEEFGYPRDGFVFDKGTPTTGRDAYYSFVFSIIHESGMIAGCNFWGWGGFANPTHVVWEMGDDYTCDPAQEEQGLNSVFASDTTTLNVIQSMTKLITSK